MCQNDLDTLAHSLKPSRWSALKGRTTTKHELSPGKLHLHKHDGSRFRQCSTYLEGRNHRLSTKEESLAQAKDFAEDWYLSPHRKHKRGQLLNERTLKQAARQFETEYEMITEGQRSARWVDGHKARIRLHLEPFLGDMGLSQITGKNIISANGKPLRAAPCMMKS